MTSNPTEILVINGRRYWGELYDVQVGTFVEDGSELDNPGYQGLPTSVATADIRGTAAEGEELTDAQGRTWRIIGVRPADDKYNASQTLQLQKGVLPLR